MEVTYPTTEDVLNTCWKGNLALTYSNPQRKTVVGNLCPYCGVYQGNTYVRFQVIPAGAFYPLEKYLVAYFDIPVKCMKCGRIDDGMEDSLFMKLNFYDYYTPNNEELDWKCSACYADEKKEQKRMEKENREQIRIENNRDGPLIECPLCKKNSRDNPETRFMEHHLSYQPEVKMWVCVSCNNKIHKTNQYPELKPKDKYITKEEAKKLKEKKLQQELRNGVAPDEYCIICLKRYRKNAVTVMYKGMKVHEKCLHQKAPRKKSKFYFM
jgi:hypothetical protein